MKCKARQVQVSKQWRIQDSLEKQRAIPKGVRHLLFGKMIAANCMKMKEIGPRGRASLAPPWIRHW